MPLHHHEPGDANLEVNPLYATGAALRGLPKLRMPRESMDPEVAYQIVHDELMLDGNARLNLATFVTTWMEPQAARLMAEAASTWTGTSGPPPWCSRSSAAAISATGS